MADELNKHLSLYMQQYRGMSSFINPNKQNSPKEIYQNVCLHFTNIYIFIYIIMLTSILIV